MLRKTGTTRLPMDAQSSVSDGKKKAGEMGGVVSRQRRIVLARTGKVSGECRARLGSIDRGRTARGQRLHPR